jgi:hypothetical protein
MSASASQRVTPPADVTVDADAGARVPARVPTRVNDELAWELVRDEWELLLAIGSGPTTSSQAAQALELGVDKIDKRIARLLDKNLVRAVDGAGFELVPAFYERREGMSSYLRDLVLRRLTDTQSASAPISTRYRGALGDKRLMAAHIARAERHLFPEVVALANRAESDRSERFSVFFAFADMEHAPKSQDKRDGDFGSAGRLSPPGEFRGQLLSVLQAAATARSLDPATRSSYLWVAEMKTDPEVAQEIGDLLERFVDTLPTDDIAEGSAGIGALAFAVMPNQTSRLGAASVQPSSSSTKLGKS